MGQNTINIHLVDGDEHVKNERSCSRRQQRKCVYRNKPFSLSQNMDLASCQAYFPTYVVPTPAPPHLKVNSHSPFETSCYIRLVDMMRCSEAKNMLFGAKLRPCFTSLTTRLILQTSRNGSSFSRYLLWTSINVAG